MDDHTRTMVWSGGLTRAAFGAVLLLAPGSSGARWVGDVAKLRGVKAVIRSLGARDIVIGLGVMSAAQEGRGVRRWLQYGAAVDALDALATLLALRSLPRRAVGVVGLAAAGAAAQSLLAQRADDTGTSAAAASRQLR